MPDPDDNLRDSLRTAVIKMCGSWDITIHDVDDIQLTQTMEGKYEATVPLSGRLILDDVLDDQGQLMYMKNDVEITLEGFQDDRLLFAIILH